MKNMKNLCWVLVGLAVIAFVVGSFLTLRDSMFLMRPAGYWRGSISFLLFAITLRLMETKS